MKNLNLVENLNMRIASILFCLCVLSSCAEPKGTYPDMDLMKHGLPIKIKAPVDAKVKMSDMFLMKDVTVKKDDYDLQIFESEVITQNIESIKGEQLSTQKAKPTFSKVIQEDPNGFIFEKFRSDSTLNYDFRYVRIQGDKQYIFQTGLIGKFTEQQVRNMYESVQ